MCVQESEPKEIYCKFYTILSSNCLFSLTLEQKNKEQQQILQFEKGQPGREKNKKDKASEWEGGWMRARSTPLSV